ncbi:hypothetical protein ABID70_000522 [Clavibacter michiganensis]
MSSASPRPTTFCPTTAEKNTNASVRSTDFGKSGSANSAV